mmetsp:Transcript_34886/g.69309  ORF Transcript_34886/g.69309 Transcript_34886/m.69309 type:complete len:224 (-) Transcript_34886:1485-2156(-)
MRALQHLHHSQHRTCQMFQWTGHPTRWGGTKQDCSRGPSMTSHSQRPHHHTRLRGRLCRRRRRILETPQKARGRQGTKPGPAHSSPSRQGSQYMPTLLISRCWPPPLSTSRGSTQAGRTRTIAVRRKERGLGSVLLPTSALLMAAESEEVSAKKTEVRLVLSMGVWLALARGTAVVLARHWVLSLERRWEQAPGAPSEKGWKAVGWEAGLGVEWRLAVESAVL